MDFSGQNNAVMPAGREDAAAGPASGEARGLHIAEGGAETGSAAAEQETFTLKYLGEEISVTREELIRLAQKGRDYDRIRSRAEMLAVRLKELEGAPKGQSLSISGEMAGRSDFRPDKAVIDTSSEARETLRAEGDGVTPQESWDMADTLWRGDSGDALPQERESENPAGALGQELVSEKSCDVPVLESGEPDDALRRECGEPGDALPQERESENPAGALGQELVSEKSGDVPVLESGEPDNVFQRPGENSADALGQENGIPEDALRREREIEDFLRVYGPVEANAIPEAVWQEVGRGVPLLSAYQAYENRLLRAALAAERLARSNAMRAVGSGATAGGFLAGDSIEDDWYKRDN